MEIKKYLRKPFSIEAVQVTPENMEEVAEWCGGTIMRNGTEGKNAYIKVKVYRPVSVRQSQAFAGDWVLRAGKGFKVYNEAAFENTFYLDPEPAVELPVSRGGDL